MGKSGEGPQEKKDDCIETPETTDVTRKIDGRRGNEQTTGERAQGERGRSLSAREKAGAQNCARPPQKACRKRERNLNEVTCGKSPRIVNDVRKERTRDGETKR